MKRERPLGLTNFPGPKTCRHVNRADSSYLRVSPKFTCEIGKDHYGLNGFTFVFEQPRHITKLTADTIRRHKTDRRVSPPSSRVLARHAGGPTCFPARAAARGGAGEARRLRLPEAFQGQAFAAPTAARPGQTFAAPTAAKTRSRKPRPRESSGVPERAAGRSAPKRDPGRRVTPCVRKESVRSEGWSAFKALCPARSSAQFLTLGAPKALRPSVATRNGGPRSPASLQLGAMS